jgi:transposase
MRRPRTEARSGDWMMQKGLTNRGPLQKSDFSDHFARPHAVHDQGKSGVNGDVFIEFLKRLIAGAKRTIFLIVDRGPAHRAKKTKAFVETLGSPDRNPDELVWKHLKADTVGRVAVTDKTDFKRKVRSCMRRLQNDPGKIRSFYQKQLLKS